MHKENNISRIKKYFNIDNTEIIYFGDTQKDLKTGENAGIEAYLIYDLIAFVNKVTIKN